MKKLATIVMLAVAMVAGGASADAKTVAKKSKARTTQTVKNGNSLKVETFLRCQNPSYKHYWYKDLSEIETAMKKLGYTYIGKEDGGYYELEDGELEPMVTIGFQKGSTEVYVYKNEHNDWIRYIGIKFGSSTEKTSFINAAKIKSKGSNVNIWQEDGMVYLAALEH